MNENYSDDYLDGVELKQSKSSEEMLLNLGALLYKSLIKASTESELRLLVKVISEYTQMTSQYGEKTGRFAESIAIDLNEATIIKLESLLRNDMDQEWTVYAEQFKAGLIFTAQDLGVDLKS